MERSWKRKKMDSRLIGRAGIIHQEWPSFNGFSRGRQSLLLRRVRTLFWREARSPFRLRFIEALHVAPTTDQRKSSKQRFPSGGDAASTIF